MAVATVRLSPLCGDARALPQLTKCERALWTARASDVRNGLRLTLHSPSADCLLALQPHVTTARFVGRAARPHHVPSLSTVASLGRADGPSSDSPSPSAGGGAGINPPLSKCPFASFARKASASGGALAADVGDGGNSPKAELPSPKGRGPSNFFDGADPFALVKSLFPLQVLVGLGALVASLLPPPFSYALAAVLLAPYVLTNLLRAIRLLPDPAASPELVRYGAVTDQIEGEFVVFVVGARWNQSWKLTQGFVSAGDALTKMVKELESLDKDTSGYLGGDSYISTNLLRGSHVKAVTYWRSFDQLMAYAHDKSLSHSPAVRAVAGKLLTGKLPELGLWHELYVVKPGTHESVYINMPPLGLGAVAPVTPVAGRLVTAKDRVKYSGLKPGAEPPEAPVAALPAQ